MTAIIGEETPWSRLFDMTFAPQYRLITVEFLSTSVYRPRGPDYQPQVGPQPSEISFRLCGFTYDLSLAEFGSALGLYTEQELTMPIYTSAIHTGCRRLRLVALDRRRAVCPSCPGHASRVLIEIGTNQGFCLSSFRLEGNQLNASQPSG
ncbi:hypothetical protein R6Q57_007580 [Mikania cordata]